MKRNTISIVFLICSLLVSNMSAGNMHTQFMLTNNTMTSDTLPCHGDTSISGESIQQNIQNASCCEGDCSSCLSVHAILVVYPLLSEQQAIIDSSEYFQALLELEKESIYHPPISI